MRTPRYVASLHAAERYAERVMGLAKPYTRDILRRASLRLVAAAENAQHVRRYRRKGQNTRVMVCEVDGGVIHLVAQGVNIATVLPVGAEMKGCPCLYCMRHRADRLKEMGE